MKESFCPAISPPDNVRAAAPEHLTEACPKMPSVIATKSTVYVTARQTLGCYRIPCQGKMTRDALITAPKRMLCDEEARSLCHRKDSRRRFAQHTRFCFYLECGMPNRVLSLTHPGSQRDRRDLDHTFNFGYEHEQNVTVL